MTDTSEAAEYAHPTHMEWGAAVSGNARRDRAPSEGGNRRWFAVHTQSHAEERATANIARQSFRTFCPLIRRKVRHARQVKLVATPLFPGYLFVSLDLSRDRWRCINGTRGVVRLLTQGDVPAPVPRGIVEAIEAYGAAGDIAPESAPLLPDQAVRICEGPFADLIGRIDRLDGGGRVRVLLNLMGRAVSLHTRAEVLVPAN